MKTSIKDIKHWAVQNPGCVIPHSKQAFRFLRRQIMQSYSLENMRNKSWKGEKP